MKMADNEQLSKCYSNLTSAFVIIAAVSRGSSVISVLACLLVAAIILLFKKYIFFTQRLVFYFCITAGLYSIAIATGTTVYFPMDGSYSYSAYCAWSGFISQHTTWMLLLAFLIIFLDMYMRVSLQKDTTRFELVYILIIFGTPLLFNWIPFIDSSYGPAGPWCWIRAINFDENCTIHIEGVVWRAVLLYVPLLLVCIVAIVLYILMVHKIYRIRYTERFDPQAATIRKNMLKEARPFLVYPWVFFIVITISLANRVASTFEVNSQKILVLFCLNAAGLSLQGGIAVVILGIDIATLRRLLQVRSYPCCRREVVRDYPVAITENGDSFRDSLDCNYVQLNQEDNTASQPADL